MAHLLMSVISILMSVALAQTPPSASAPPAPTQVKKSASKSTGDIDMNQFDDLKPKPKPADAGSNIQVTCTDPKGTLIKKGERGFDTCLANAQSPVMNQPRETERENDPRKP